MRPQQFALAFLLSTSSAMAGDLRLAPPPFQLDGETVVPIDITNLSVTYEVDVGKSSADAEAILEFRTESEGMPLLDFLPNARSILLDGLPRELSTFPEVAIPPPPQKAATTARVLKQKLEPGAHTLVITYSALEVPNKVEGVSFVNGGVSLIYNLSDYADRGFMEQFVPANFEFDRYPFRVRMRIQGQKAKHDIYTNGEMIDEKEGDWTVQFPDYFTASSPFFYLTPNRKAVRKTLLKEVEILVFAQAQELADRGFETITAWLPRYEKRFGPYPHRKFVAWITGAGSLSQHFGMEYAGGTVSDLVSLRHEILHSWFGRGIMPANGNAAWIDEGIVTWAADKFGGSPGIRYADSPAKEFLMDHAKFSPYFRKTEKSVYASARWVDSLDLWLERSMGQRLDVLLRAWLAVAVGQTVSTEDFRQFVIEYTGDFGRKPRP
jgi:hypothetical protein